MQKKYLAISAVILSLAFLGEGCDTGTLSADQSVVQATHDAQTQAVPLPRLTNSLERINISKRLTTFDDPNKVSYIYLIDFGRVMAFYTIKGKVTSGGKRLTQQMVSTDNCGNVREIGKDTPCSSSTANIEAPELDGTFGSSNPYVFFWTTDGTYVQWSGEYMLVDQPLKLTTQPDLVREVK